MSVRSLKPSLSSSVRSAHTIDSVTQCVIELVQNSVDARASSVIVNVDSTSWRIQVSDNGEGIARDELVLVGERYATSKCHDLQDLQHPRYFGFRGEALASIVQVARTVELNSRHRLSQQTYYKVFQCGRGMCVVSSSVSLSRAGMTVTVHDLFYNLPVRRKQLCPSLVVERLKSALCKALLVFPHISISLRDDQASQWLLHASCTGSLLSRFCQLFGRDKTMGIRHTSVEHAGVKISALLSVRSRNSRCLQLMYVNRRHVENRSLHTLVCRLMEPVLSQEQNKKGVDDLQTKCKSSQRPFYVIVIEGDMDFDVCLNPAKTSIHFKQEDSVRAALACLLCTFQSENHCCPSATPSVTSTSPTTTSSSSKNCLTSNSSRLTASRHNETHATHQPIVNTVSVPWKTAIDLATSHTVYIHPMSGCTLTPDKCTGTNFQQPKSCIRDSASLLRSCGSGRFSMAQDTSSIRVQSTLKPLPNISGLPSLLSGWRNPTFSAGDGAVLAVDSSHNALTKCKFSKSSLQHIKVFGQVDSKFIACHLEAQGSSSPDLLVAIDQHAAHERVRLEVLLEGLYNEQQQVREAEVVPPLALSLTPSQETMARYFSDQLAAIGVQLQWRDGQPMARTLPAVLMEREAGERQRGRPAVAVSLLQEMVCSHLELLQSTHGGVAGLPSSLAAVLHSQACHGAIRFGDSLCLEECEQLVYSLAHCTLPFQCAHGRPSLAPLLDLHLLKKRFPGLHTPFPSLKSLQTLSH